MKSNFESLTQFASEIERREQVKNDYIVPSNDLSMISDYGLYVNGVGSFAANEYCHGQIAQRLGIPKAYYDKMTDIPGLRTQNVNAWIKQTGESRFVRTLDGTARAMLSDRFKPIDNYALLSQSIFPAIEPFKSELCVKTQSLSDTRMYLQIVFKNLQAEVKPGDVVQYGLTISNSEVGAGAVNVESLIWRLACTNGMVRDSLFRKYHVGRKFAGDDDEGMNFYANDTIQKELEAYQLRLRDTIKFALTEDEFLKHVAKLKEATEDHIENITPTVQNITKRFGLTEKQGEGMIINLVQEGNTNRYGLANSITHLAHSIENADRQYDLEKLGSAIIDMTSKEWKQIAA